MVIKDMPNLPHEDIQESVFKLFVDEYTLLTASDVAKKIKVQRITATKHLRHLERGGFVKIAYETAHFRLYRVNNHNDKCRTKMPINTCADQHEMFEPSNAQTLAHMTAHTPIKFNPPKQARR